MPKPIFVITICEVMDMEKTKELAQHLTKTLKDYHVLITFDRQMAENKYQLFSEKDIQPIELEELKKLVLKSYEATTGK